MSRSGDWFIRENPYDDDSGYDIWLWEQEMENRGIKISNEERAKKIAEARKEAKMLEEKREEAIAYVESVWRHILLEQGTHVDKHHSMALHDAIWYASTEILPGLEVQAVIDDNEEIFVSTGTAGYVDYLTIDPSTLVGMKLPIQCWIHTHPFGSAYFSGTDWRTISIWGENMECAYVLGSDMTTKGHYGYWSKYEKNVLNIFENNEHVKTQKTGGEEE